MNPVLPLSLLIPLILVILGGGAWLSWKSSQAAPSRLRKVLLGLRVLALLALVVFLINPGQWQSVQDQVTRVWAVMIDSSRSMSVVDDANSEQRRIDQAKELQQEIIKQAEKAGVELRYYSYDQALYEIQAEDELGAKGDGSDLTSSADALLTRSSAQGESLAGVMVFSDGRQTHTPRHSNFKMRAQALQVPFFGVVVGGDQVGKDLALNVPRKTVTAFPGQNVQITAMLESDGLGCCGKRNSRNIKFILVLSLVLIILVNFRNNHTRKRDLFPQASHQDTCD